MFVVSFQVLPFILAPRNVPLVPIYGFVSASWYPRRQWNHDPVVAIQTALFHVPSECSYTNFRLRFGFRTQIPSFWLLGSAVKFLVPRILVREGVWQAVCILVLIQCQARIVSLVLVGLFFANLRSISAFRIAPTSQKPFSRGRSGFQWIDGECRGRRLFITREGGGVVRRLFAACCPLSQSQIHTCTASQIAGSFMFQDTRKVFGMRA
jgi:hypothetical protein